MLHPLKRAIPLEGDGQADRLIATSSDFYPVLSRFVSGGTAELLSHGYQKVFDETIE
jgi:hypothetical protein